MKKISATRLMGPPTPGKPGMTPRFTPEFHFLYMLTHIAKHIHGSGAGLRMYLDLAAFIRHHGTGLDWPWIEAQLRASQPK